MMEKIFTPLNKEIDRRENKHDGLNYCEKLLCLRQWKKTVKNGLLVEVQHCVICRVRPTNSKQDFVCGANVEAWNPTQKNDRVFAKSEDSHALRLESKLSDLRAVNANLHSLREQNRIYTSFRPKNKPHREGRVHFLVGMEHCVICRIRTDK